MQSETFINSQVIQQEVFSSVCQEVAEDCVACVENRLNDLENAKANSLGEFLTLLNESSFLINDHCCTPQFIIKY